MRKDKMKKGSLLLVSMVVLVVLWSVAQVKADELDDLNQQLSELQNRIANLEAKEKTESEVLPESLKWLEKIKISGDLRYRHEHTDQETEIDLTYWSKICLTYSGLW